MKHLLTLAVLVSASACSLGLERDPPEQARYLIGATRPAVEAPPPDDGVVEVRAFHAASPLATIRFLYRIGAHRYETDFYREFLVAPELAISDAARAWLAAAGVATAVVAPGSRVDPTHVLEGDVTELYGDFRSGTGPRAVLVIRAALVERTTEKVLLQATYAESEPIASADADGLPAAWSTALARVLERLEADVRTALGTER